MKQSYLLFNRAGQLEISELSLEERCKRAREKRVARHVEKAKKFLIEFPKGGVFYDAGWGDHGPGHYYLCSNDDDLDEDNDCIDHLAFVELRKSGLLGGNTLITMKARAWYPHLQPGERDLSTLGDKLYRNSAEARHKYFTHGFACFVPF